MISPNVAAKIPREDEGPTLPSDIAYYTHHNASGGASLVSDDRQD